MGALDDWLTTSEAAKLSGYHPHHILRLIKKGEISARKWGNAWMISRESMNQYIARAGVLGEKRGPKPEQGTRKSDSL